MTKAEIEAYLHDYVPAGRDSVLNAEEQALVAEALHDLIVDELWLELEWDDNCLLTLIEELKHQADTGNVQEALIDKLQAQAKEALARLRRQEKANEIFRDGLLLSSEENRQLKRRLQDGSNAFGHDVS